MTFIWSRPHAAANSSTSHSAVLEVAAATPPGPISAAPTLAEHRSRAGAMLTQLFAYFAANTERHPTLATILPQLSTAVGRWRSGAAGDPYAGVRAVHSAIEAARRLDPAIPEA